MSWTNLSGFPKKKKDENVVMQYSHKNSKQMGGKPEANSKQRVCRTASWWLGVGWIRFATQVYHIEKSNYRNNNKQVKATTTKTKVN